MRLAFWRPREDLAAPDGPPEVPRPVVYVLRRTVRAFTTDRVLDVAAGLTYFAVLAVGPGLIAFVSLLSLLGQSQSIVDQVLALVGEIGPDVAVETVQRLVDQLPPAPSAGRGLVFGLLGAVWAASAYVSAFARAMNRVHGVEEGRPFWHFRPVMFVVTLLVLALAAVVAVSLIVSGPLARTIGRFFDLGSTFVEVWNVLRWPLVTVLMIVVVASLYYLTPNVKQRFRWLSPGATVAILGWIAASAGFNFYVAQFGRYDAVYGSLAGFVVFLLWLWISNIVLLVGAELDVEIERYRQLRAGIPAEQTLQYPPRETVAAEKRAAQAAEDVAVGRAIREEAGSAPAEKS